MSFDLDNGHAPVVLDIAGTTLNADDRRRLQHPLTGGLILFARNWESRAQLTALTAEIKAIRPDVLVCVDHEGGRVQRFRSDGFTHLPPMRTLGELWMRDALAATDAATACGHVLGAELRACGVDLSFTPVLDLDHGGSSVIGDRAFHRDARVATMLAKSLMHGLLLAGMANCGKHFPGHGFVQADSHHAVPVDKQQRAQGLRLAAHRAPPGARVVPGEQVDVQPVLPGGTKSSRNSAALIAPACGAAAGVDDVGDLALDAAVVVAPQRQVPQRVVQRQAAVDEVARHVHARQNSAGSWPPSATRAAPVSVARSIISSGLPSAA
jgi:hypothetical protein